MTDSVPGPDRVRTPEEFVAGLRQVKAWTGLSYRDLARRARANGDVLPASTVASALNRASLPNLELVTALLRACGGGPETTGRWISVWQELARSAADRWQGLAPAEQQPVAGAEPARTDGPSPAPERLPSPCLLPPDRQHFVGRATEFAAACELLRASPGGPTTLLVTGPAGVGKTTFAVRLGHAVAAHFPDGQLYVDLHGAGPEPAAPAAVLGTFLRALGVRGGTLPAEPADRVDLYRTLLARRRVLVVLDNAANARQVEVLLPNGSGCAAVVTGRTTLAELEGVRMPLGVLGREQALTLLGRMVGEERTRAEPESATAIVDTCGRLPLAVWVVGARLAARPHWSLSAMARALGDEHRKLDELVVGDIAVRASLELSYHGLDPRARYALRLLSLLDAPDFAPWALAALLDTAPVAAERLLDDLVEVHLVEPEPRDGTARYRLHDLVRAFARERALRDDPPARRAEALERLLGASLHLAETAAARLSADFQGIGKHRTPHWSLPAGDVEQLLAEPLTFFDVEHAFLLAIGEQGLDGPAVGLAAGLATALTTFFQIRSHFDDWYRLQDRALVAARAAGDRMASAKLHRALGERATILDRYEEAVKHFERSLECGPDTDPTYTASATAGLAYVHRLLGRYDSATTYFTRAIELAVSTGNVNCLIYASNGLGVVQLERGEFAGALDRFTRCLHLSREVGYRPGEAQAYRCLGQTHRALGEYDLAAGHFAQAAAISASLGDRLAVTHAKCWLGDVRVRQGRPGEGRRLLAESLWTYREFANAWGEAAALYGLAGAQLAAGRPARARARALAAVRIWRGIGAPYWLATGLELLAEACRADEDEPAERAALAEARALREPQPTA
ncbi:tetratricopeptide repeat protein [Micromonospora sp. NPDC049559]|uniref:ATP-binding protein n=1 Tax=Micromonospora sp. NPDC049559 TaxID=3155923 RepID=UPI00341E664F